MSQNPFSRPFRPGRLAAWSVALLLTVLPGPVMGCRQVFFYEDFSSFAGWTVINGGDGPSHSGGNAPTWTLINPGGRNPPGLTAPFAIVDSFANGLGLMHEELISPLLDTSGMICLELAYSHDFQWYPGFLDERAEVRIRSGATGGQWVTVRLYAGGDASGTEIVDLTAYAGANLQVSFRYTNANWEEYWAVDDVAVLATAAGIFVDGFESGATGAWSAAVP